MPPSKKKGQGASARKLNLKNTNGEIFFTDGTVKLYPSIIGFLRIQEYYIRATSGDGPFVLSQPAKTEIKAAIKEYVNSMIAFLAGYAVASDYSRRETFIKLIHFIAQRKSMAGLESVFVSSWNSIHYNDTKVHDAAAKIWKRHRPSKKVGRLSTSVFFDSRTNTVSCLKRGALNRSRPERGIRTRNFEFAHSMRGESDPRAEGTADKICKSAFKIGVATGVGAAAAAGAAATGVGAVGAGAIGAGASQAANEIADVPAVKDFVCGGIGVAAADLTEEIGDLISDIAGFLSDIDIIGNPDESGPTDGGNGGDDGDPDDSGDYPSDFPTQVPSGPGVLPMVIRTGDGAASILGMPRLGGNGLIVSPGILGVTPHNSGIIDFAPDASFGNRLVNDDHQNSKDNNQDPAKDAHNYQPSGTPAKVEGVKDPAKGRRGKNNKGKRRGNRVRGNSPR